MFTEIQLYARPHCKGEKYVESKIAKSSGLSPFASVYQMGERDIIRKWIRYFSGNDQYYEACKYMFMPY